MKQATLLVINKDYKGDTAIDNVIMVPHDSSKTNCLNYHWHIVVNRVSYIDGQMLYDRYKTYHSIINYLNQNPYTKWNWSYKKSARNI